MGGESGTIYKRNRRMKRFEFLGIQFSAVNMTDTLAFIEDYNFSEPGYISFPDSSVIAMASKEQKLQEILNHALLTLPDGKPSQMAARAKGFKNVSTVSGFWLCQELLKDSRFSHFFLGSTPDKLMLIKDKIERDFPEARIAGYASPDFFPVDQFRNGLILEKEMENINSLRPDLIWIGLSSPKQDYLMKFHAPLLKRGVMLGVGGVFDYLSGEVKKSPEWVKKIGLRWLWRLSHEPKRLGPKYFNTIKFFLLSPFTKK
jgi:N-acetylglucosaminyldiphosphoundecaprenol N-acetyl-beta-D-mannosaminyltransferase